MVPSPPASETAAASSWRATAPIPAWTTGTSRRRRSSICGIWTGLTRRDRDLEEAREHRVDLIGNFELAEVSRSHGLADHHLGPQLAGPDQVRVRGAGVDVEQRYPTPLQCFRVVPAD